MSFLIVFLLLIALLLRVDFIFYMAYVCLGLYAWSRWYPPRAIRNLQVQRTFTDHAFLGETLPITLQLKNPTRLPLPWLQLYESTALGLRREDNLNQVVSLGGRETAEFTYHLQTNRRGYYQVGPLRLETGDQFGFFPVLNRNYAANHLTVYPRITPLSRLGLPSRLPFGTIASQQRLFEDPARPMGVREFRSGDSLRQINWKVSGHTRQLMVKTFQPAISLETAVFLNLHADDYNRQLRQASVEWAIELAASLAAHLSEQRQAIGLMTNGVDPLQAGSEFETGNGRLQYATHLHPIACIPSAIPPRSGRSHLIKILETLARLESDKTIPLAQWLVSVTTSLSWGVTLLIITPHGDETTCQACHRLVRIGFNPVLITVEPDYNFVQVKERARRLGFAAYHVAQPKDLDRWRSSASLS